MKDRDIRSRSRIEAKSIKRGQTVEVDGTRIRCDHVTRGKGGHIKLTKIPLGGGRVQRMALNPRKKVDLLHR